MDCPCGNERSYDECCGRFIDGDAKPDTAEALMRSRYSAYATENIDYVLATHDPETADELDRDSTAKWAHNSDWQGLEIMRTERGGPDDDNGEVEFIATYTLEGNTYAHHELSTFRRIDGQWFYVDGEMVRPQPVRRESPKVGRNEPCPCGSGKKYKKCHGR